MTSDTTELNQYGLITRERAEKFDLLGQLILNQREAVILCGAKGIGKTTLLNAFKKERENIWVVCLTQGRETLGFSQIQTQLVLAILQHNSEIITQDLPLMLNFCEQQQQKVVLMIDDAGVLPAGLITTLTEYSLQNPVLRLVFTFTREQLYQKNRTDRVVDDCYFIELSILTKPQTALFLQDLSVFPNADNKPLEITDKLLSKFYQRTAGIPGKIILELPLLVEWERKKIQHPVLSSVLFITAVVMSVVFFQLHKSNRNADLANLSQVPPLAVKPVKPTAIAKPNSPIVVAESVKPLVAVAKPTEPEIKNPVIQQDADEQWVLQQAAKSYTLQLMALSKRQALLNIVKKHPNLETALKILRVKNKNRETYLLLYGAYPDNKTAYAAVSSLPAEFSQAWPRKITILQQEIKNRAVLLPNPKQLPLKQ